MGRLRAKTADKNKLIGFLFLMLLIFSLIFCIEPPNADALGDIILRKIGLDAWSSINGGFHYTVFYAFIMFIIGFMGTVDCLMEIYPRFIKRLPILLIAFLILLPYLYSFGDKSIKSLSSGIDAVSFNKKISKAECTVDSEGNFVIKAELQFHNYSSKDVAFYIKINPGKLFVENFISEDLITATDPETGNPKKFTVPPKSDSDLQVVFKTPLKTDITNFQGSMSSLDIIIFTESKEKSFIKEYQ